MWSTISQMYNNHYEGHHISLLNEAQKNTMQTHLGLQNSYIVMEKYVQIHPFFSCFECFSLSFPRLLLLLSAVAPSATLSEVLGKYSTCWFSANSSYICLWQNTSRRAGVEERMSNETSAKSSQPESEADGLLYTHLSWESFCKWCREMGCEGERCGKEVEEEKSQHAFPLKKFRLAGAQKKTMDKKNCVFLTPWESLMCKKEG